MTRNATARTASTSPGGAPKVASAQAAATARSDDQRARLPIDDSLFFKLVRVVNLTARPFSETIGRANRISINGWRVLLVLASHPGIAAREVAVHTGLDKMTVSRTIAALGRQRRITKRIDAADKRRTRLWLNAAGRRVYERIGVTAKERERGLFAGVGAAAQAQMGRTLDRLIETVLALDSEANAGPPQVRLTPSGGGRRMSSAWGRSKAE